MRSVGIIGGGLAGLSAAILLQRNGFLVVLYEQKEVVRHRVCGEYISRESDRFLNNLGLDYDQLGAPTINRFKLTSAGGVSIERPLKMGARGLSRFRLESELLKLAEQAGVEVMEREKVEGLVRTKTGWEVESRNRTAHYGQLIGAWGKRSNLDKVIDRPFYRDDSALSGFLGVKYHRSADHAKDVIELHNFPGGYCGFSAIEDDKFCMCYLVNKQSVNDCNNSIEALEEEVLSRNTELRQLLTSSERLYDRPLVISNVSFARKQTAELGFPVIGDAAGLIAPLSGNGMSIAFHSSKLVSDLIMQGLTGSNLLQQYKIEWHRHFNRRFKTGRWVQTFFGKGIATETFLKAVSPFPKIADWIIQQTHGETF